MTAQQTQSTTLGQLAELVEYCLETRQKVKELETGLELAENSLLQAFRTTGIERLETPKAIAYIDSGKLIVEWKGERER